MLCGKKSRTGDDDFTTSGVGLVDVQADNPGSTEQLSKHMKFDQDVDSNSVSVEIIIDTAGSSTTDSKRGHSWQHPLPAEDDEEDEESDSESVEIIIDAPFRPPARERGKLHPWLRPLDLTARWTHSHASSPHKRRPKHSKQAIPFPRAQQNAGLKLGIYKSRYEGLCGELAIEWKARGNKDALAWPKFFDSTMRWLRTAGERLRR